MQTFLSQVNVKRFRGIDNLMLPQLGLFNLFVGENNSGKTSVLEAISLCARPLDSFQWIKAARGRDVPIARTPIIESVKWLFPQSLANKETNDIELELQGSFAVRKIHARYRDINAITAESVDESPDELGLEEDLVPERGAVVDITVQALVEMVQQTIFEQDEEPTHLRRYKGKLRLIEGRDIIQPSKRRHEQLSIPVRMVLPHTHRIDKMHPAHFSSVAHLSDEVLFSVLDLLRQFDPDIESVSIVPRARLTVMYLAHKTLGSAPVEVFGDGLRRILQIALTIPLCRNGIMLVDELETSIHAKRLKDFFSWLLRACRQFDVQLFATTHSLEAIDALLESSPEHEELITYKFALHDHRSESTRYDRQMLHDLRREFGMEIR